MESIQNAIEQSLNKIRPFLQRDGGDVEFVKYEDGVVYVKMVGACDGCSVQDLTLSEGIEQILIEEVPGVIRVEKVI